MEKLKIWAKANPKQAVVAAIIVLAILGGLSTGAYV